MEKYTYLIGGLSLMLLLAVLLLYRKDLAPKALKLGLMGGLAGLVGEYFFLKDYWQPPSVLHMGSFYIEDFVFGFAITALCFVIYPLLFGYKFGRRKYPVRRRLYLLFFAGSLVSMLGFNLYVGINSILVTSIIFSILSTVIFIMRPDLLVPALYSTSALMTVVIVSYMVLFNIISPAYWDNYWLLARTKWGVTILGNLPMSELLWYGTWLPFASIS